MPPPLALLLTLLFIGYLLRRDSKEEPKVSGAIWIPTIWLMIIGSRSISIWLDPSSGYTAQRLDEGSPIDKAVYAALILAGICVLAARRVRVSEILSANAAIWVFLLYEGISVVWSDFPLVAFKRWGKALGDPVMVLVLWSDPVPARAITAAIKRCAYVLIPLSVLFCKYYEHLGRTFQPWGESVYTGVTTDKNMLGYLLFAFGVFFVAALMTRSDKSLETGKRDRSARAINVLFMLMIGWLALIANSKTAMLSLLAGTIVVGALRFATVRRRFGFYVIAAVVLGTVSEALFSLSTSLVEAAGRDMTFTGRTGLWETLLREPVNPIIGVGYASFWLGERLTKFWAMYPNSPPIEAHNGYLEVYLNLGIVGVCLVVGVLLTGLWRMRRRVASSAQSSATSHDRVLSIFGIAYGSAYLLYNITEATFQGLNFLFVMFLILAFHYSPIAAPRQNRYAIQRRRIPVPRSAAAHVSGVR